MTPSQLKSRRHFEAIMTAVYAHADMRTSDPAGMGKQFEVIRAAFIDFETHIRSSEREACAALADEFGSIPHGYVPLDGLEATAEAGRQIAAAIRAREINT